MPYALCFLSLIWQLLSVPDCLSSFSFLISAPSNDRYVRRGHHESFMREFALEWDE